MERDADDLEDAKLSDLLRRWGRQASPASPAPLFERPARLPRLEEAMVCVDLELASRGRRRRWLLASAAGLVLSVAGIWLLVDALHAQPPSIEGLRVSRQEAVLRAAEAPRFRSGERVYLHFRASRPGWGFVAMLDGAGDLAPVSSDVRRVAAGDNVMGPFRLDDQPGTESFIVVVSAQERTRAAFEGWIPAAERIAAEVPSREAKLIAALETLKRIGDSTAEAVTFEHTGN